MPGLLINLYPASWRDRYGDEFAALLEERTLGPFDVADIILGALDAHLHSRGHAAAFEHRKGFVMSLRIGGYAAILGGLLWFAVLGGNTLNNGSESGSFLLGIGILLATAMTLVALVGLSAFQARRHPVLVWFAFAIPAAGALVGLLGALGSAIVGSSDAPLVGGMSGWIISTIGLLTLIVGSALFALATLRTRSLSRPAALLLAVGSLLVVPLLAGILGGLVPAPLEIPAVLLSILVFPAGWVAVGLSALSIDRGPITTLEGAAL